MSANAPWKSTSPPGTGAGTTPSFPPTSPPGQTIPVGSPPASAGDPELLPRHETVRGIDVSAEIGAPANTLLAFRVDAMTEGELQGRPKAFDFVTWQGGSVASVCGQFRIFVGSLPHGADDVGAVLNGSLFLYDGGAGGIFRLFHGVYSPALYVPPLRDFIVFVSNQAVATDPDAGALQKIFCQWRLL